MSARQDRIPPGRVRFASIGVGLAALTLAGCTDRTLSHGGSLLEPTFALDEQAQGVAAAEDELNAQLQRDIDDFLARRREAAAPSHGTALTDSAPSGGTPAISWNTPARSMTVPVETRDATPSTGVLATPEQSLPAVEEAEPSIAEDPSTAFEDRLGILIVDLSRELHAEAAYADMPLREMLLLAATRLVRPDWDLDEEVFNGLTDRERDVLMRFHAFFAALGHELDGQRDLEAVLDAQLTDLRTALEIDPNLNIPTAGLCTRVAGFGDYDAFPKNGDEHYVFLAHHDQQAIVYIEVENFASELNAQNEWITELSQQVAIYSDHDGMRVWGGEWQGSVDRSRKQRHDYFTVQVITLPRELSVGRYHLKVRLRDEQSGAESEASMMFEMVADARLARSQRPDP